MRALARAWRYVRHDIPEQMLPSSMEDPPHVAAREAARRQRTAREHLRARSLIFCSLPGTAQWSLQLAPIAAFVS